MHKMKIPQILTLILISIIYCFCIRKSSEYYYSKLSSITLIVGVEDRTRTGDIQNHNLTL